MVNVVNINDDSEAPGAAGLPSAVEGMSTFDAEQITLGRHAEALAQSYLDESWLNDKTLSPAQAIETLHELRVRHIELQMIGEELRSAQVKLDAASAREVNERQQMLAAFRKSEAELNNILRATSDGILAIDDKGKVILFNQRFGQLWRLPQSLLDKRDDQVLLNHVLSQLTDPEAFVSKVQALYSSNFEGVDTISFKDGRIFERFTSPLHSDSSVIGRIWSFRDITERKALEERATRLAAEQKAILQNDLVGIMTVRDRRIIWANPAFETMLGYGPGEMAGTSTNLIYLSEQSFLDFGAASYPVLTAGHVFRSQLELRRRDGTSVWVNVSASSIIRSDSISLWVFADITESKLIAEQIAQSEARLSALFETALDAVISMDDQGRITSWNRQAESMFGWSTQEAIGLTLHDTIAPQKYRAAHQEGFSRFLATGQTETLGRRIELTALRRSGEEFPVELSILPFKQNNIYHFTAFVADISTRKLAEELVRKLAYYDPLTGLANRTLLKERLIQSMMASDRSRRYGALMFIDLDNFKPVNDLYGHPAGDLVLIEVAKRLKTCVRKIDTVSRIGGDEFVVLLNDFTADRVQSQLQTAILAEKVRDRLADLYSLNHHVDETQLGHRIEHQCSASIGVVLFLGIVQSEEEIMKSADAAMYQAKGLGRNQVCIYQAPEPQPEANDSSQVPA